MCPKSLWKSKMKIKIASSKSGHEVFLVNDFPLHSTYDPIKEANLFVDANLGHIKTKNNFIIFGLANAYHINALVLELKKYHESFFVTVIEAIEEIGNNTLSNQNLDSNLKVFSGLSIDQLYQNQDFLKVLLAKPKILIHQASFNLNTDYYTSLLKYEAPTDLKNNLSKFDAQIVKYFKKFPDSFTLKDCIESMEMKDSLDSYEDLLLKSINEFIEYNRKNELGFNYEKNIDC